MRGSSDGVRTATWGRARRRARFGAPAASREDVPPDASARRAEARAPAELRAAMAAGLEWPAPRAAAREAVRRCCRRACRTRQPDQWSAPPEPAAKPRRSRSRARASVSDLLQIEPVPEADERRAGTPVRRAVRPSAGGRRRAGALSCVEDPASTPKHARARAERSLDETCRYRRRRPPRRRRARDRATAPWEREDETLGIGDVSARRRPPSSRRYGTEVERGTSLGRLDVVPRRRERVTTRPRRCRRAPGRARRRRGAPPLPRLAGAIRSRGRRRGASAVVERATATVETVLTGAPPGRMLSAGLVVEGSPRRSRLADVPWRSDAESVGGRHRHRPRPARAGRRARRRRAAAALRDHVDERGRSGHTRARCAARGLRDLGRRGRAR